METIPLRDAVQALRAEILSAAEAASAQAVRFELGPIEMEFQVVAKREGGGDAKLGFHIFTADASLGANAKAASERTQRVKFVLNPVLVDLSGQRRKLEIGREPAPDPAPPGKHPLGRE